jgi:flagellar biosynthesis/type III secretory pathway M-ring protein FliF/YscJ
VRSKQNPHSGWTPFVNFRALQKYPNFPHNFAPDFLQYRSEDPNQRKPNKKRKKQNQTMKWLQLAYSIISVNAVILALLAVIMNLLRERGHDDNRRKKQLGIQR